MQSYFTSFSARWVRAAILLSCVLVATSVTAVTLLEDNRLVRVINDSGSTVITPPTAFVNWNTNSQFSTFTDSQWVGLGSGSGESDVLFSITESFFDVTFSVAQVTLLDLQGSLSGEDGSFGLGQASVALFAGASIETLPLFNASAGSGDFLPYSFVTLLQPGTYRLLLETDITPGGFGTFAEWSFVANFEAQPVPIPAMGWIMAVLLLSLRQFSTKRGIK